MKHQQTKTSYHPYLLVAFYLNCLPENILQAIPRSTRFDWQHRDVKHSFGYDWFLNNKDLFNTLQMVALNKKLLKKNRVLVRAIAINRFIKDNATAIRRDITSIKAVLLGNIQKMTVVTGLTRALKYVHINFKQYARLKRKTGCAFSSLALCRIKHPAQLLQKEIESIKKYCVLPAYQYWPLCSIYHQMIKDGVIHIRLCTFYKYVSLLSLNRKQLLSRRKNHTMGIRATAPFQILHADLTEFKTGDHKKAYIYLVQDNFSRAILAYQLSTERRASYTFENLAKVKKEYLDPAAVAACTLLTDDGSENYGDVKKWISENEQQKIKHLIAQTDIHYSNSMIEAANKQLKYRFLYQHSITDFSCLDEYVNKAITDFNNRPHHVLKGLTPIEVLNGKTCNKEAQDNLFLLAKQSRISANQQLKCCEPGF